ncbi:hypothetical protein [Candidatus Spongiihabitans sp.]|uniref:hypothetical protein n=1 Tax=Candidatus Spongiihabitans sp. TaxID=3101308 RepID=UPI003C7EB76E
MPGLFRAIQLNICHAQRDSFSSITLGVSKKIIAFRFTIVPPPRHCPACSGQSSGICRPA